MFRFMLFLFFAALSVLAHSPASFGASTVNLGPKAVYGTNAWSNVRMPPNNLVSGAIGPILASKTDPKKIYVGAVNGGVWVTSDGGTTWTSLTDSLPSQSIGALAFDANNSNNLYAGAGNFSNYGQEGGPKVGLYGSTDAGSSWRLLGGRTLTNTNLSSVVASGNTIVVGSVNDSGSTSGLFRSIDGGRTFQNILGTGGLPSGTYSVTSIASDPSNPSRIYAVLNGKGIYRSDNGGWSWTNVSGSMSFATGDKNAKVAVGAGGKSLFVGIVNSSGQLSQVWTSTDYGATWKNMGGQGTGTGAGLPGSVENGTFLGITPGKQGFPNFSLVADPVNPNIVYVGGDRQPSGTETATSSRETTPRSQSGASSSESSSSSSEAREWPNSQGATSYTANLFRGDSSLALGSQWSSVTNSAANSTAPHADARSWAFDASGNLFESDDGGVNKLSNPGQSSQSWSSANGNLSVAELHCIAFDTVSGLLVAGAQDIGTLMQVSAGSSTFKDISGGDGGKVAFVKVQSGTYAGNSMLYTSNGNLGNFTRTVLNSSGATVGGPTNLELKVGSTDIYKYETSLASGNYYITIAPYRGSALTGLTQGFAIGTGTVYWVNDSNPASTSLALTDVGLSNFFSSYVTGLSFTEVSGKAAILAGVNSSVYYSANVQTTNISLVSGYSGGSVRDVLLAGATSTGLTQGEFFVVGGSSVYNSTNTGTSFTKRISRYGLSVLKDVGAQNGFVAVGGFGEVWAARDASLDDWYLISNGLPKVQITGLSSDDSKGVIYMSTLGRGIWSITLDSTSVPASPGATLESGHLRILRASSGDQTLNGGILQAAESISSAINIGLQSLGGTFDTYDQNATLSGVISGVGAFTKTGSGALTLTGVNTYLGGTALNGGSLIISSDSNLGAASGPLSFDGGALKLNANWTSSRNITLNQNWGEVNTNGYNSGLSGIISGVGGLYKSGSGILTLSGVNTYQGGTYITGGTLSVSSDNNLGQSGTTLGFDGGTLATSAGITSSRIIYIASGGGTIDTQGNTSSLSGVFYGTGSYTQTGSGKITLYGDATYYTGAATISAGTLNLGRITFGGALTISSGASLTGNGVVANLTNNGTVSPGNSIGLITVTGNYSQSSGALLRSEVEGYNATDQLVVLGSASLSGSLEVAVGSGDFYRTGQNAYSFVSASGGVSGGFSNVSYSFPDSPVLSFRASVTGGELDLEVTRAAYAKFASNSRQAAAGNGLNLAAYTTGGDLGEVIGNLDFSDAQTINQALSQLHPEPYDALTQSAFTGKRQYFAALGGHLSDARQPGNGYAAFRGVFDGGSPALLAARSGGSDLGPVALKPNRFEAGGLGIFIEPFAANQVQQNAYNRTGFNSTAGGLMGGFDYRINEWLLAGGFAGYYRSTVKLKDIASSQGNISNYSGGVFASVHGRNWWADAVASLGGNFYSFNRGIAFPGVARNAGANFNGLDLGLSGNAGYMFNLGKLSLGPVGSLDYIWLNQPGFTEQNAGGIGLKVRAGSAESLKSSLGLKASYEIELGRLSLRPEASLLWGHEFMDNSRRISASYLGGPGSGFSTPTASPNRDTLRIRAGFSGLALNKRLGFYLRLESELGSKGYETNSLSGGLKMSF